MFTFGLAVGIVLITAGCHPPQRTAVLEAAAYPPDFTLVFFVAADEWPGEPTPPASRPAQHTVTPDRILRAALGPGVSPRFHPPATATLSVDQMAELYRWAEQAVANKAGLPAMSAAARPEVVYRLSITTHGESDEFRTTPTRNPSARKLLERLIDLRGGR